MSHEIRTPLYGILGTAQLLQITPHLTPSAMICGQLLTLVIVADHPQRYSRLFGYRSRRQNVSVSDEPFEPRPLLESTLN